MKHTSLRDQLERSFTFRLRPKTVPGDLRPEWRICVILLMLLRCGRGGKMSLKKAHILNWGVLTLDSRKTLIRMVDGQRELSDVPVRFDPALNRAIDFARAEGLLHIDKKTTGSVVVLHPKGQALAQTIYDEDNCLDVEKGFFDLLRKKLPEERVEELLEWETTL